MWAGAAAIAVASQRAERSSLGAVSGRPRRAGSGANLTASCCGNGTAGGAGAGGAGAGGAGAGRCCRCCRCCCCACCLQQPAPRLHALGPATSLLLDACWCRQALQMQMQHLPALAPVHLLHQHLPLALELCQAVDGVHERCHLGSWAPADSRAVALLDEHAI